MQVTQKKWHHLKGFRLLVDVTNGVKFTNEINNAELNQQDVVKSYTPVFDHNSL